MPNTARFTSLSSRLNAAGFMRWRSGMMLSGGEAAQKVKPYFAAPGHRWFNHVRCDRE